jgi:hypothetical protein
MKVKKVKGLTLLFPCEIIHSLRYLRAGLFHILNILGAIVGMDELGFKLCLLRCLLCYLYLALMVFYFPSLSIELSLFI